VRVYYNEFNPFAANWIRRLIAAGAIPAGEVDTRPIQEVRPEEISRFDQCHFFAGIGVWAYALQLAQWPDDLPIWTGSCPCQPHSRAGKRRRHEDPRDLWPDWYRLIDACKPPVVVGEQVSGTDGYAWLDRVSADVEDTGYAIGSLDLSAAGVGSPQDRPRLYFVAEGMAHATRLDGQGIVGFEVSREGRQQPDRGAGAHRLPNQVGWWEAHDIVACRDGWGRPVEPGTHPVAPRSPAHMDVMSGLGNSIVAPLAAEFLMSYLDVRNRQAD
jgi:DNA (cytosine-5)-methyltransferase 1